MATGIRTIPKLSLNLPLHLLHLKTRETGNISTIAVIH